MEQNKPQTEQELTQQAAVRRQKLADLCEAGHNPFEITKYAQDAYSADLKNEFADLPAEAETGKIVSLAGRMMSKRIMGKASFAHLRDQKGDIQIFVKRDLLGDEAYAAFKKLDIGDIIGVKGEVFRTKMGEISVRISELTLLSKSLLPLPEKFHGLTDREARYRQRYVDLIMNPEVKDTFVKRSLILKEIRAYLPRGRADHLEDLLQLVRLRAELLAEPLDLPLLRAPRAQREARLPREQRLWAVVGLQRLQQLREDAAHGPHVDGGVVVLLEEDQFRGTVPTRHHVLRQLPLHGGLLRGLLNAGRFHVHLRVKGRKMRFIRHFFPTICSRL